jgi:signal transduction histidine kinase
LRGGDEAGVLAAGLDDLLALIAEKVEREKLRAARDKDMWRAIGHEIRSPIQALSSLHDQEADPSYRYIKRMQRAVTVLYENASPEVAIASAEVEGEQVDLDAFLKIVAANAPGAGLDNTVYASAGQVVPVRGDPAALEDVITHVLKNAIRYRRPESAVTMSLVVEDNTAVLSIHDVGPQIPDDMLEKIFEYGVSDQKEESEAGGRGQGLYVARSYMAKMGGTIAAKNADDGVTFEIRMPLTK